MKLVRIHGPGQLAVDDVETPDVGPRDVLLKIDACGICGSDLTFAKYGFLRADGSPWPLGHEAAGTVVAAGNETSGFLPGARMVLNPMGDPANVVGNGGPEGAFANLLLVRNAQLNRHLLPMPEGMSAELAALVEPLGVALHGVNQAKLSADDKVVVYGAGPIGLGAVFWLSQRGMRNIVSVDLSDARLERARKLGAHHVVNPSTEDLEARLREIHGSGNAIGQAQTVGSDVYLDMAGAPSLLQQTLGFGKYRARVVLTAIYPAPVPLDLQKLVVREIAFLPAVGYPDELPDVIAALAESGDALAHYISDRFRFDDFESAFEAARNRDSGKVMILFD